MVWYVFHTCVKTMRQQLLIVSSGSHTRTLTDICIPHKNTQYISILHSYTMSQLTSCNLELSIFSSYCTATLTPCIVLQTVLSVDVLIRKPKWVCACDVRGKLKCQYHIRTHHHSTLCTCMWGVEEAKIHMSTSTQLLHKLSAHCVQ